MMKKLTIILMLVVCAASAQAFDWVWANTATGTNRDWMNSSNWGGTDPAGDPNQPWPNELGDPCYPTTAKVVMNIAGASIATIYPSDANSGGAITYVEVSELFMANGAAVQGHLDIQENVDLTTEHLYSGGNGAFTGHTGITINGTLNIVSSVFQQEFVRKGTGVLTVQGDGILDAWGMTNNMTFFIGHYSPHSANPPLVPPTIETYVNVTGNGQMRLPRIRSDGGFNLTVSDDGKFTIDPTLGALTPGDGTGQNWNGANGSTCSTAFLFEDNAQVVLNGRINDNTGDLAADPCETWTIQDNAELQLIGSHFDMKGNNFIMTGGRILVNDTYGLRFDYGSNVHHSGGIIETTLGSDMNMNVGSGGQSSVYNLSGTGKIGAMDEIQNSDKMVITGGIIAPGSDGSGRTRYMNGLVCEAGATTSFQIGIGDPNAAISFIDPNASHDVISLEGDSVSTLIGTLDLTMLNGYVPDWGETFTVITTAPGSSIASATFTNLTGTLGDEIDLGMTYKFTVQVTANEVIVRYGVANAAPVVGISVNENIIVLPATDTVNLTGTQSDDGRPPEGSLTNQGWSKISGSGTVTFGDIYDLTTTAQFSEADTYVIGLTADDSDLTTVAEKIIYVRSVCQDDIINEVIEQMDGDVNMDCNVDLGDLGVVASEWLDCNDPEGC